MLYLITLFVLIGVYGLVVYLMKFMTNKKLTNLIFCLFIWILYIVYVIIIYNDVGKEDWNFLNTLPVANVSPFMFSIIPFILLLPEKAEKYAFTLVSLLCVGMFLSTCLNCVRLYAINYMFHPHFLLDYIPHFALSLWGIYLVRSEQVSLNKKECIFGGLIIVSVATIMLVLNIIFDTSFFGLSLNGKHNIYNNVLVSNSYLSAFIYFSGLIVVLTLGFGVSKLVQYIMNKNKEKKKVEK